jgi:hypothetical protein
MDTNPALHGCIASYANTRVGSERPKIEFFFFLQIISWFLSYVAVMFSVSVFVFRISL